MSVSDKEIAKQEFIQSLVNLVDAVSSGKNVIIEDIEPTIALPNPENEDQEPPT